MKRRALLLTVLFAIAAAGCKSSSGGAVEVKIALEAATPALKRATVIVDYSRAGATIETKGGQPACASILPHVSCRFSDEDGKLRVEAESPQGFSGPADLAVCRMTPSAPGIDGATIASKLSVALLEARGGDGQPIEIAALSRDSARAAAAERGGATTGGSAATQGATPGEARAPADSPQAGSAPSSSSPAAQAGEGMVVTREDLQERERKRAEEQLKKREADAARGSGAGQETAPGYSSGVYDGGDDEIEDPEPGTGVNDPTDDDARATAYMVAFDLGATSGPLGALQFDVDYNGGSGGWLGAGGGADCRWLVTAALHACNDKRGGSLTCALVDTNGFSGPTPLMECVFKSRNSVAAGDFSVRVTDVSTPGLEPADATVFVSGVYPR